jgi:hypothetical protein
MNSDSKSNVLIILKEETKYNVSKYFDGPGSEGTAGIRSDTKLYYSFN